MESRKHFVTTDTGASANEHFAGVLRLAQRLEAYTDLNQFLHAVPAELHTLLTGLPVALILREDWGTGTWFAVDGSGNSIPGTPEIIASLKAFTFHLQEYRSSFPLRSADPQSPLSDFAKVFQELGNPSLHVFALNMANECFGALCIGRPEADSFMELDMHVLAHIADMVALAIDDRLVRAQLERERTKLKLILDINNSVGANLELRDVLRSISPSIQNVMQLDTVALILPGSESAHLQLYELDSPERKGVAHEHVVSPFNGSISGQVFRSGKAWIGDVAELQRSGFDYKITAGGELQTLCMLPLIRFDRVLGVLCLARRQKDGFTDAEIGFLSQLTDQIAIAVDNALAYRQIKELSERLKQENLYLEDELRCEMNFEEIVGTSAALKAVLRQIEAVAPTNTTVLIHGETGTGKELIARAVHKLSRRRSKAFVKLNCAAIPTGLLESELFGHEKGAFTGAIAQRIGRFELASEGTIFLDEVGEIPLDLQPKLLRVLQEREFERLGSSRTLQSDGRLIAATNRDLSAMVRDQTFRSDLFYRLNVFPIHVPALRQRTEDIPFLVRHFAQHFARNTGKQIDTISSETMRVLVQYPWPGNIREMQNVIERAVILSKGHVLQVPVSDLKPRHGEIGNATGSGVATLEEVERRHILSVLEQTNWVFAGPNGAAARLGLKRPTLQFRMQKLGITRPRGSYAPPRNPSLPSS